jgi:predicted lipid carrier protein YhbT
MFEPVRGCAKSSRVRYTKFTKEKLPVQWVIYTPGGRLVVDIDGHSNATLTGPAVLIGDHDISRFLSSK